MSLDALQGCALEAAAQQLIHRQVGQVFRRPIEKHAEMQTRFCLTFRPGDRTGHFNGKLLRPVGSSVLIVLSYEEPLERRSKRMPLRGYRAQFEIDGSVSYGVHADTVFDYEGDFRFRRNAHGRCLDPYRNPSLGDLLLRLDRECSRRVDGRRLPWTPQFPRILLGFAPSQPPQFEDTPALRRLAAKQLRVPLAQLGANGEVLLQRLLEDIWQQQLLLPRQGNNGTDLLLVDAELCSQARTALRAYEDFSDLIGIITWNPAREIHPFACTNPAQEVLAEFGIDRGQDFCQAIEPQIVDGLVARMKQLLAERADRFTEEEILDGITSPERPLQAWTAALPQLRAKLAPAISEGTTDLDLLRATRDLDEPLFASGVCRVQVLRRRPLGLQWDLYFTPEDLNRRISADLSAKDFSKAKMAGKLEQWTGPAAEVLE